MSFNNIVVVTGFGPFRIYKENPSWEAVKIIDANEFNDLDVELIKFEIPVVYETAEKTVQKIWNELHPKLVIHCGVSSLAKGLHLEKRAVLNQDRYCLPDVSSCLPKRNCQQEPIRGKQKYLCSNLDLEAIRNDLNEKFQSGSIKLPGIISDYAGEYLCEYTYKCSLQADCGKTLFIHVPECSDRITVEDISKALVVAIKSALKQLRKDC
ncbi:Pyroglutamyl-peptidase 1 [Sarcoptes scabiei]|uniref:Pyroglutamyl-peptidase 1 n=1 Tax=Sarcoptes scabiei TaxID=52283 RepID=A0A834RA44_SARSC|nr:Pyroglutamyl-peptidase 1 [Sarcoptes scabiei]UXI15846.1 hypothetical protein NH340_JMT01789 [Sarcoptes scabiei]